LRYSPKATIVAQGDYDHIDRRTEGRLRLHPGTLYRALARLVDDGLVELRGTEDTASAERRRPVKMTKLGARVARAESERLAAQVTQARERRWLRKPV
jgi:DNA-binding PadR family transcriptional regulator